METSAHVSKRSFNKEAYQSWDSKTKTVVQKIFEKKGYKAIAGLEEELYKECDVKFQKGNKIIRVENEVRENFDIIKDRYSTIHIPVRKKFTLADFYFVWNEPLNQFFLINRRVIESNRDKTVHITCHEDHAGEYEEDFLDIPKTDCKLFYVLRDYSLLGM